MPREDGTGPMGQGPMTGRGLGPCGTGMGRGFGRGRFFGFCAQCPWFRKSWTKKDEADALEEEEKALKEDLQAVQEERRDLASQK